MFERFTDDGRQVMVRTADLGAEYQSPYLRRHHLLIALLDEESRDSDGVLTAILDDAEVDRAAVRTALLESLQASETPDPDSEPPIAFSHETKKLLEVALREALSLGHNYIAVFHMLLAILRTKNGPLEATLATTGLDYDKARGIARRAAPGRDRGRRGGRGGRLRTRTVPAQMTTGVDQVLTAATRSAKGRTMTTGDLLVALLETADTHFARLVASGLPADAAAAKQAADRLVADDVDDGVESPKISVDEKTGSLTIHDPELAKRVQRFIERDR